MQIRLPRDLNQYIESVLVSSVRTQRPIQVYAEAEKIRRSCLHLNIALEDIVELFITTGKDYGSVFEINVAHASEAVLGSGGTIHLAIETPLVRS